MREPNTSAQRAQEPARTDRYTKLPDALIAELTPREHQLVHVLLSYRWYADSPIRPYVGTMAARLRCSERTIQRTLSRLEEKGYIVRVARYRDQSDAGHHGQTSNEIAPGPMLLPLLPPLDGKDDGPEGQPSRAGVTPVSGRRREGNYPDRSKRNERRSTPPSTGGDFLMTRYGPIRPRELPPGD